MTEITDIYAVRETMRAHKICIIIPTFNNDTTLAAVIGDVLSYTDSIIVINDGSTDSTAEILNRFADSIHIVSSSVNKGKGNALKKGFEHARKLGYRHAITIDSDGQHRAADIPAFVRAIVEHPGALIVGQRNLSSVDINAKSSFANKFSNFWFRLYTGRNLRDTQTGYRAYPLEKIHGMSILTNRYEAELELLVFAAWNGVKIVAIPIDVYYPPQAERVSHFRPGIDFTRISLLNTVFFVAAIIYGLPKRIYNSVRQKKLFNKEIKFFTRKNGIPKEAATTLGRLSRSIFGISYFSAWAFGVFNPGSWVYFNIGRNSERKKYLFRRALQLICQHLTQCYPGAPVRYLNPSGEDFKKPAIIVCNHQSHLDLPVIMSLSPKLIFLTNDWAWHNPFYSQIIHHAEFLPTSAGMDIMLPKIKNLRDRGYSIVIFPEGTRSADCSILRFHQGAFRTAQLLGMDILPLTLHGAGHYLPKKDFMFRKNPITLSIHRRQKFDDTIAGATSLKLASRYRKQVRSEYERIAHEQETCNYFKALVLYKYAYRGWRTVSKAKRILSQLRFFAPLVENLPPDTTGIRIINGGIGVVPLFFALVNPDVQVYVYEENIEDFTTAVNTPCLPANLHFIHTVWTTDHNIDEAGVDKTFVIESRDSSYSFNCGNHTVIYLK